MVTFFVLSTKKVERLLLLTKVFLDGLDRVGATIVALSVIGGLLANPDVAMETTSALMGVSMGLFAILVGGYLKERVDATLKDVQELLSNEAEDTETEAGKTKDKEDKS